MSSTTFNCGEQWGETGEWSENSAHVVGENGALSLSSMKSSEEDYLGSLCEIFLLTQNDLCVEEKVMASWNLAKGDKDKLIQLMKMILFIREPRAGKGLRKVFYEAVFTLYKITEARPIAKSLMDACSEFGYWGDLTAIWNMANKMSDSSIAGDIMSYVVTLYGEQLKIDFARMEEAAESEAAASEAALASEAAAESEAAASEAAESEAASATSAQGSSLSLAGKWAPRVKSSNSLFAKKLVRYLKMDYKEYRHQLSRINKHLQVVEPYMCSKRWKEIDFTRVPSVAMTSLSNAFSDVIVNSYPKKMRRVGRRDMYTRNRNTRRHSPEDDDYEDREACRVNLSNHIESGKKINSAVTSLSKIVEKYLNGEPLNQVWEAQWTTRVNELRALAKDLEIFPMIDLSGSMNGDPIINAITLGIFTASILDHDLDKPESVYANRFMTFSGKPLIVRMPRNASLYEKIQLMTKYRGSGYWGNNTNISSAVDMLLSLMAYTGQKVPKYLAIFSDMQFDQGDSSWNETSYQNVSRKFENAGQEVPHIIFWNLRSNLAGYQVSARQPNSTCLSGFSTRMMDLFLSGAIDELKTTQANEEQSKHDKNTLNLVMKVFEHKMFTECKKNIFGCFFV
jgi:hypothetical protein